MDAPSIKYAKTRDGVSIAYATLGEGPAVLGPSRLPLSDVSTAWALPQARQLFDEVFAGLKFVFYDPRGFGSSGDQFSDWSLDGFLLDVEAVAKATGIERFALWGSGVGGAIVSAFTARHPDEVAGLFLHDAYT